MLIIFILHYSTVCGMFVFFYILDTKRSNGLSESFIREMFDCITVL